MEEVFIAAGGAVESRKAVTVGTTGCLSKRR